MQIFISSDLILDADHSLDFLGTQEANFKEIIGNSKGIQGNAGSSLSCFTGMYLVFEVFQTRVAHFCFALLA